MTNENLYGSIENLYEVFAKYPLKNKIEGCPCCVGEEENLVLHSKPLRELTGEDLSYYGFKAMTTFGDIEDFKHFLPRLFELIVLDDFAYNEETLFGKLNLAGWRQWHEDEKTALENFFSELVRFAVDLEKERSYLAEIYLVGIANVVEDITPYLDLWLEEISENRIYTLKFFVVDRYYGTGNAFLDDFAAKKNQIESWLTSQKTVSLLEKLFYDDSGFQEIAELSEILEAIYRIKSP